MLSYNQEYKKLVQHVLDHGKLVEGRNGNTLAIPHYSFVINDLVNDDTLLLRKTYPNGIIGEFKTLMSKDKLVNNSQFIKNGCNYWTYHSDKDGSLRLDYYDMLHPQLEDVILEAKSNPNSRRLVVELWNYKTAHECNLPPCWRGFTLSIIDRVIHMTFITRSQDLMLGTQADIKLASLFMSHIAKETGYMAGSCMYVMSNIHIYEQHINNAKEILKRSEKDFNNPLKFKLL